MNATVGAKTATDEFLDLGYARLDISRAARTGDPEVVYGPGKTAEQVTTTLRTLHERTPGRAILGTRLSDEAIAHVRQELPGAEIDALARTAVLGPTPKRRGRVLVLSAGTADAAVSRETSITVRTHGASAEEICDVGVAGLHRLLAVRHRLDEADALVVVAGMEGALPSVVGGLTGVPLIGVPTSTGYGTGAAGYAAMLAMLNSCAPGLTVVNIDNGYGAGVHAARIARRATTEEEN